MSKSTEEKLEAIRKLINQLDAIRESKELQQFIMNLKHEVENSGMEVRFTSRIKEEESAVNKGKRQLSHNPDIEPYINDYCGTMMVVDGIDEVYAFATLFKEKLNLSDKAVHDYIQAPKAGYRSVHLNFTFLVGDINVPLEIQIKTEDMSIAQDTTHDSIYKLEYENPVIRDELSTVLFPIFEKNARASRLEMRGDIDEAIRLRKEAEEIRQENITLLSRHQDVVNKTWKEYGKVLFKHHNLESIQNGLLLKKQRLTKEDIWKMEAELETALEKMYEYYSQNIDEMVEFPIISGNRSMDYVIHRFGNMDHSEFVEELKKRVSFELEQRGEVEERNGDFGVLEAKQAELEYLQKEEKSLIEEERKMRLDKENQQSLVH